MESKIITASALTGIITALLVLGGVALTDKDVYYCENSNTVMRCDSLAKYYSLPNGKCNNAEVGNKLCRTGWIKVENDMLISNIQTKQKQYLCSTKECIEVK